MNKKNYVVKKIIGIIFFSVRPGSKLPTARYRPAAQGLGITALKYLFCSL